MEQHYLCYHMRHAHASKFGVLGIPPKRFPIGHFPCLPLLKYVYS